MTIATCKEISFSFDNFCSLQTIFCYRVEWNVSNSSIFICKAYQIIPVGIRLFCVLGIYPASTLSTFFSCVSLICECTSCNTCIVGSNFQIIPIAGHNAMAIESIISTFVVPSSGFFSFSLFSFTSFSRRLEVEPNHIIIVLTCKFVARLKILPSSICPTFIFGTTVVDILISAIFNCDPAACHMTFGVKEICSGTCSIWTSFLLKCITVLGFECLTIIAKIVP